MTTYASRLPAVTQGKCSKCGKSVKMKKVGTLGQMTEHPGAEVYHWIARRGGNFAPISCPERGYHTVSGLPTAVAIRSDARDE